MKITDGIYLVGSGQAGCMISHRCDSHVYLLESDDGHVLIDAGVGLDNGRILENAREDGLDPSDIAHLFLTHSHADHAGGAAGFKAELGCRIYIGEPEADLLESSDLMDQGLDIAIMDDIYPGDYVFPNCPADERLSSGDTFTFGPWEMTTVHVPGHSTGSMCYHIRRGERNILFSGDVVLHSGKLMFLNCVGSVMADMRASMPRLADRGVEELYPGHGCWVCAGGQSHINKALEALRHLGMPPNAL